MERPGSKNGNLKEIILLKLLLEIKKTNADPGIQLKLLFEDPKIKTSYPNYVILRKGSKGFLRLSG